MFNAYEGNRQRAADRFQPADVPQARRTNAPASLCDVLPTMAELAGADTEGLEPAAAAWSRC